MPNAQRSIHEIDSDITFFQHRLSTSPRSHAVRPQILLRLGILRFERNTLSNQCEDLDKSICHFTELILLPHSGLENVSTILEAVFSLAGALLMRSKESNQPERAISAAIYLRYLRAQPHQSFGIPRHQVTTLFVVALAIQVESEAGNVMQNIGEMADLCREVLTATSDSNMSSVGVDAALFSFVTAIQSKDILSTRLADLPFLDQVIGCLQAARMHKPELRAAGPIRGILSCFLSHRYLITFSNDDYEEAVSVLDEMATSGPLEESQRSERIVTMLTVFRSKMHENPEYSEETLYRARAFLNSSLVEDPFRIEAVSHLEDIAKKRFSYFGSIEGLDASSGNLPLSEPVPQDDSISGSMGDERVDDLELITGLLSGIHNDDTTKIDEALEKGRTILTSSDQRDPRVLIEYSGILVEAFRCTKKIEYLDESISILRQVSDLPFAPIYRFPIEGKLSMSLMLRCTSSPDHPMQDLNEGMELLLQLNEAVDVGHRSLPERFQVACDCATLVRLLLVAQFTRNPFVSRAYESALSLMQDTLLFAPTLQQQHDTLATSDNTRSMPLDYASHKLDLGQLDEAIVTLERGRSLLWSEMRRLRTSIEPLLEADPDLGHKFAAINRDLEDLTKSIPPDPKLSVGDDAADGLRGVDPFGRSLLKQRSLLKERIKLISQIQALPGFDGFLASPSFDTLRSAASSGPVIIINHSEWRSDILILLHSTSPSLISTSQDFYYRASALKDELLESRHKHGLDSSHYDQTLASVLAELYELVGKPVIDRLHQLHVPEQSRIWWCPTSVFCFLPLHAMGPIPSDDDEKRYFLDLYICSYTPTLSALIQSRDHDFSSRSSDRPSLLLVAQHDSSLPTVGGEIQVVQTLDAEVTSLISEAATPAAVIDGFHQHRFVHFACHGRLEARKPFDAGFELYEGERLTLLEIVRSHLPTAEFAFLSACHTAEVTEGSIADEGLHLAAAVQYCGFRSVVGTTWAMVDEDGRDLADYFYKALFETTSRREQGIPYHERSAKALRSAVKKLRRKRKITLERWVNFVHYGA